MLKVITNSVLASEIADFLEKELIGEDVVIYLPGTISKLKNNCFLFVDDIKKIEKSKLTDSEDILILTPSLPAQTVNASLIITNNPVADYFRIINHFFTKRIEHIISETSMIEEGAIIGENVLISSGSFIGSDVVIGADTIIWENVVIKGKVKIGRNCTVKPNAVIGSDIFDFVYTNEKWEQFPQLGEIIIEDDVVIGANATIEKGTISDTVIKKGVKIDDLVQIGSNCHISFNTFIAAGTIISRDVQIGENCWLAPNVSVRDNILIGNNCIVGIGSVIINNIPDNQTVVGNPATPLKK